MKKLLPLLFATLLPATSLVAEPEALSIKDLAGKTHQPLGNTKTKAVVVVFISTDCPIANFYQPALRRLAKKYAEKGVSFYQIHPDPELPVKDAKKHLKDFDISVPVAIDYGQKLVKHLKATTTPEAFVLTAKGKTAYRGRIDDTYTTFGKRRPKPTKNDLQDALEAVLAGKEVSVPVTDSVGCRIYIEK